MIFDTKKSFAMKNEYNQYSIVDISLFEIDKLNQLYSDLSVTNYKNKELIINIKCPICEGYHNYKYNINDIMKNNNNIIIGGCDTIGLPVFFLGNPIEVHQRINKYLEINKECTLCNNG